MPDGAVFSLVGLIVGALGHAALVTPRIARVETNVAHLLATVERISAKLDRATP